MFEKKAAWAIAARRYLALRKSEFLQKAIDEAEKTDETEILEILRAFAGEDPGISRLHKNLSPKLEAESRLEEELTITLLSVDLGVRLVENFQMFSFGEQMHFLDMGIEYCSEAVLVSQYLNEKSCEAFYLTMTGNGLYAAKRFGPAVGFYNRALDQYNELALEEPQIYDPQIATASTNLGTALSKLGRLEQAINSYEKAIEIYERLCVNQSELYELSLATALNNQGDIQRESGQTEQAIRSLAKALVIRRKLAKIDPELKRDVAETLNNLGIFLCGIGSFRKAIAYFSKSLKIKRKPVKDNPEEHQASVAATLNNLGNAQRSTKKIEQAIEYLNEALKIRRRLAQVQPHIYGPHIATTLNNLGNAQYDSGNSKQAVEAWTESIDIYERLTYQDPQVFEPSLAQALNNLGHFYTYQKKWKKAIYYFLKAREIVENLQREQGLERRRQIFQQYASNYRGLLSCYFNLGYWKKALEVAEQGKSRSVSDLLNLKTIRPKFALDRAPSAKEQARLESYADLYEGARTKAQQLGSHLLSLYKKRAEIPLEVDGENKAANDKNRQKRSELERKIAAAEKQKRTSVVKVDEFLLKIRRYDKDFPPRAEYLTEKEIFKISRESKRVIVLFRFTQNEIYIFIVFPNGKLKHHSIGSPNSKKITRIANKWFEAYDNYLKGDKDLIETARELEKFKPLLVRLYSILLKPVHKLLETESYREVLFIPSYVLAVLPLHAGCWTEKGETRYLLDDYTISYATSVSVFKHAWENARNRKFPEKFLFVTNPTGDLKYSKPEVNNIIKIFGLSPENPKILKNTYKNFYGNEARWKIVNETIRERKFGCYHFSCHAKYDSEDAFSSLLSLSNGQLTLKEIMETNLSESWLTTLSACETGLVDINDVTDEHYGFPLGFVFAGCPSVWSTLWSVDERSTSELMRKAYQFLKDGESKIESLRQAQIEYRREKKGTEQDLPYYWAGFQHYGV
jgi:CHAT domain-containing protein/Tfp pilus assembly protein PilF